jgi:hypothetical protein
VRGKQVEIDALPKVFARLAYEVTGVKQGNASTSFAVVNVSLHHSGRGGRLEKALLMVCRAFVGGSSGRQPPVRWLSGGPRFEELCECDFVGALGETQSKVPCHLLVSCCGAGDLAVEQSSCWLR